ncbi:MAG: glycosyltransferase [Cyanobacteriota bacterium]
MTPEQAPLSLAPRRRWQRKLLRARQVAGRLLRGDPDPLLRVAAERLVPRLELHPGSVGFRWLRLRLLQWQPGCRSAAGGGDGGVESGGGRGEATARLYWPSDWPASERRRRRVRRRLAARLRRSGAALVSCDDWVIGADGRHWWRQKPLHDPLFDRGSGIGAGPLLASAVLAERLEALARQPGAPLPHTPAWRELATELAADLGGRAHLPLPLLLAPPPVPLPVPLAGAAASDGGSALAEEPLVSLLIPTAGTRRRIDGRERLLVREGLRSLLERSRYRRLEVVLIDGGELAPDLVAELEQMVHAALGPGRWQFLRDARPYSYSERINRAAAAARGELLLQLNDDTELLDPEGITWLVRALQQEPGVGVVGALLLYPDGPVQHAGVAIDNLAPRHAWAGCRPQDLPWGTLEHRRRFLAVTAAVCLCRRELWRQLDGLRAELPINYGDVDFCLRAAALGQASILEPRSRWLHFESASRPVDGVPPELPVFADLWAASLGGRHGVDPYVSVWRHCLGAPLP